MKLTLAILFFCAALSSAQVFDFGGDFSEQDTTTCLANTSKGDLTVFGSSLSPYGYGSIRTFVTVANESAVMGNQTTDTISADQSRFDFPLVLGVEFTTNLLSVLEEMAPSMASNTSSGSLLLQKIPDKAFLTPFSELVTAFNLAGQAPVGALNKTNIMFHFHAMPRALLLLDIPPGSCDDLAAYGVSELCFDRSVDLKGQVCVPTNFTDAQLGSDNLHYPLLVDCNTALRALEPVNALYTPTNYAPTNYPMPYLGDHIVDTKVINVENNTLTDSAFDSANNNSADHMFVWGRFDASLVFWAPTLSVDFLNATVLATPGFRQCYDIPYGTDVEFSSWYPSMWCVEHAALSRTVRVTLEEFLWKDGLLFPS